MAEASKPSGNTDTPGLTTDQNINLDPNPNPNPLPNNDKNHQSSSSSCSPSPSPSLSQSSSSSSGFDCNICLELAQEPVVTLCGHLFCWPCLYRWLHSHSTCQDCPVCKALVEEDKLVPLYGRGGSNSRLNTSDPRRKQAGFSTTGSGSHSEIPQRPQGQRPQTAPRPNPANYYHHNSNAFHYANTTNSNLNGVPNMAAAAARFGNFTFSAGFGIFPSLFGFHMQGFPDLAGGGGGLVGGAGYPFGFPMGFHGAARAYPPPSSASNMGHDQQETKLSRLLMFLGILVVLYILFF